MPGLDLEAMDLSGGEPTGLNVPGCGKHVGVQDGLKEGALDTQTSLSALSGKLISIRDGNSCCAFFARRFLCLFLLLFLVIQRHGGALLEGSSLGELEGGGLITVATVSMSTFGASALAMAGWSLHLCT